jgi:hypothetical protein
VKEYVWSIGVMSLIVEEAKAVREKAYVSLGPLQTHMAIFWDWNWAPALGG